MVQILARRVAAVGDEAAALGALLDHNVVIASALSICDPLLLFLPALGFSLGLCFDLLHLLLLVDIVL